MLSTDLYERGVDVVPISARVQMETNSVVIDWRLIVSSDYNITGENDDQVTIAS